MHHIAVPFEAQPGEAVDDGVDGRLGRALAVRVLDAQQEAPAVMARIEPVEQSGPGAADMQIARGRGGEAGDDGHCAAEMPVRGDV
jgi:hypothetical protein